MNNYQTFDTVYIFNYKPFSKVCQAFDIKNFLAYNLGMTNKTDYTLPWTSPERYRAYASYDKAYADEITASVAASTYKTTYHIQPKTGLLNDPNGFSFFNGKYHLFYQVFPYGPVHGLKSWGLMTSTDLIHWQDEGLKLFPDTVYDSHGAYSGSALPLSEEQLFLFYTGNTRGADKSRAAYQNGAIYSASGEIKKFDSPLLTTPKGYTDHFRDPMIFDYQGDKYAIIGAQTAELQGAVVLAHANDASLTSWAYSKQLAFTKQDMGYMIECPNLVFIEQTPVLLFCPQGLDQAVCAYDNIFPNMYVIADGFDPEASSLTNTSALHNLDDGFEVYATQAFNAPDGRVLASSWLGLPDLNDPSLADGWQGILSLVKELTFDPYLRPLYDALYDMLPADIVDKKLDSGEIEIAPLAYMRGRTLSHAVVILDEAQNTTGMQMKMFLTRLGEGSRMIINGDLTQTDLPRGVISGLIEASRILKDVPEIAFVEFSEKDVVRHGLVSKIVKAYEHDKAKENNA